MARKFYVVWEGRAPGIYDSWEEAQAQVEGFPGARYKSFTSQTAATEAFRNDGDELYALRALAERRDPIVNYEAFPEIRLDAIAVDAACAGNPGVMEYRGVVVGTGEELFHYGPVADGTNNVGEFLALVHALALCEQKGWVRTIYSDSRTAQAWLRNRKAKPPLKRTAQTAQALDLLARAERWIQTNGVHVPVQKWNTEEWGEIPADFGRK